MYDILINEQVINIADYIISDEVFFIEHFDSVELWFTTAWRADEFERKVHLFCLGYQPVTRRGMFL
jgi:DNA-binding transcriptional regulator/RsmH inhibitor MraZ